MAKKHKRKRDAAPEAGRDRRVMAEAGQGGYKGGRRDRRATRNWRPPVESADAAILPDLLDLRQRSRDLARNMPLAAGALATTVTNVVGDGLEVLPHINAEFLGLTRAAAREWEKAAKREFEIAAETADWSRIQNFEALQAMALRSSLESGDVLVIRSYRKDPGDLYGTKVKVIEADRVSNPDRKADTDTLVAGVAFDGNGVPKSYHVASRHPGALRGHAQVTWKEVPAFSTAGPRLAYLLYERLRPEQTRGAPYLSPIVEALKQLGDYMDAEVTAAVNSAMIFAIEQTPSMVDEEGNPVIGSKEANNDYDEITLSNGAVISTLPGAKIEINKPGRPNSEFNNFVSAFCTFMGAALQLPEAVLLKRFVASYSASRAALESAWQFFRIKRSWFGWGFCQPYYEWVIEEAVATGRLVAPGFFEDPVVRAAWLSTQWIGSARWSLDPVKDANADEVDVRNMVKSRARISSERIGTTIEQTIAELGDERRMLEAEGLAGVDPAAPADDAGDDEDEGDDDTEDGEGEAK